MSFILDALRKAERERSMGQTPTMSDVAIAGSGGGGKPPRKRAVWLAVVVVVLAVLLVVVMVRKRHDAPPPPQAGPAAAPPTQVAVAPPPATAPVQDNAAQTLDDVVDEDTADDVADEAIVGEDESVPDDESAPEDEVPPEDDGSNAEESAENNGPPPTTIRPQRPVPETPRHVARIESERPKPPPAVTPVAPPAESVASAPPPADAAVAPAENAVPAEAPPPEPEVVEQPAEEEAPPPPPPDVSSVKKLRDMPAAYRANFPAIKVQVHVYDPDPSKRWVLIGDRKYVEGATLSEGPRVDAIVEDGIVFELRGERVLYALTR